MIWERYTTVIICVIFFIFTGCKKKDQSSIPSIALNNEEIVCPLLYQKNDSIANALNFIEAPEDEFESYISSIQKTGELVSGDMLKFANKYLSFGTNKDPNLFISMLSEKTRETLDDDSKNGILIHHINAIKEGTFINSENEYKYLAVYSKVSDELLERLANGNFTQIPTHRILFYHFHRPKYMLIGSSVYVIEEQGSYKIVTEKISKDKLEAFHKKAQPKPKTQEYGVVLYEENDNAYNDSYAWKYKFEIAVRPEETITNTFEMLKLTKIISSQDNNDLHPDVANQVLVEKDEFGKYKDKQLNFKFYIGSSEPRHNFSNYGQKLSGWGFGFSIASFGTSSTMFFHGKEILNIQINKEGDFIGSDLELMSFESEKDGVRYKNRVLLRKTPIEK